MRLELAKILSIALLLGFLSLKIPAQVAQPDSTGQISLSQQGRMLRVQVHSTTSLREVLTALCNEQKLQCAGTESLSSFSVPSMTVNGTVEEVIADLLQGTEVNYNIARTGSGAPSKLTVLGHAPAGTLQANAPANLKNPELARQVQMDHMPVSEPESAEESARSERVMQLTFGGGSNSAGASAGTGNNGEAVGGAAQASSTVPEFLPFPDEFGNPIRTTPSAPASFLPFPDHNGNPIPVTPVPVTGPPIPLTEH